MKRKRIEEGTIELFSTEVRFDSEGQLRQYKHYDTNQMVEEMMLLANKHVAEKIFATFPDVSVLRRHPPP